MALKKECEAISSLPSWSRVVRGDFEDAAVSAGEEREFGDPPFYGQVRSKLQSINPLIWEKGLILKYFIILA
jgi:hypothetical protein